MSDPDKADHARKSLVDSVKGKAKEIAGAVSRNDSLTAEGQLQQAQARERKQASVAESVADAEVDEALTEVSEARAQGDRQRVDVNTAAAAAKGEIQAQQQEQKRTAEQAASSAAAREVVAAHAAAQQEGQQAAVREGAEVEAAQEDFAEATAEHETAVKVTDGAKDQAERLRRRAEEIGDQADLP